MTHVGFGSSAASTGRHFTRPTQQITRETTKNRKHKPCSDKSNGPTIGYPVGAGGYVFLRLFSRCAEKKVKKYVHKGKFFEKFEERKVAEKERP